MNYRFYHMNQVLLYLPLRNPKHSSQLIGCEPSLGQKINDALTERTFRGQHDPYGKD
jgi:hypothetical protein